MDNAYLTILSKLGTITTILKITKKVPKALTELSNCISQFEKVVLKTKQLKCGKSVESEIIDLLQATEALVQEIYKSKVIPTEQKGFMERLRSSTEKEAFSLSLPQASKLSHLVNTLSGYKPPSTTNTIR